MSETSTSPSREFWLLHADSWLDAARWGRWGTWGTWGLGSGETERGVEDTWPEGEREEAGQMGVKAEAGGRVELSWAVASMADLAAEAGGGRVEAAEGEESAWVDGWMDEASMEEDWAVDGGVEEGGSEAEDDGALEEGVVELMTSGGWSGDRCPGDESVSWVSSVVFGILLWKQRYSHSRSRCYHKTGYLYLSCTSTVMVSCFSPYTSTLCDLNTRRMSQDGCFRRMVL